MFSEVAASLLAIADERVADADVTLLEALDVSLGIINAGLGNRTHSGQSRQPLGYSTLAFVV